MISAIGEAIKILVVMVIFAAGFLLFWATLQKVQGRPAAPAAAHSALRQVSPPAPQ